MKCPKVTLRSRPISHGRRSLYLDYYPAIRIPDTMKKTRTETLGIYVYARPRSQHEKSHNDEMYRKARLIASTRLPAIINKQYGFLDTARGNRDFLEYFRQISRRTQQQPVERLLQPFPVFRQKLLYLCGGRYRTLPEIQKLSALGAPIPGPYTPAGTQLDCQLLSEIPQSAA